MVHAEIKEVTMDFYTEETVFSPSYIDRGTLAMLAQVEFHETDKVLDLGCGYGVVGILAAKLIGQEKVVMCDNLEKAVELAGQNAKINGVPDIHIIKSNGLEAVDGDNFTLILSNPPFHTDFSVAKGFIEKGYKKLAMGGKMIMVTKRRDWYKNKLTTVFGGVRVVEADGYYIFLSEKRARKRPEKEKDTNMVSRKLQRRHGQSGRPHK